MSITGQEVTGGAVLDCGCIAVTVMPAKAFVVRPCSPDCENWHTIMGMMAKHSGKPTDFVFNGGKINFEKPPNP